MFFYASKILWFFTAPSNVLVALLIVGLARGARGRGLSSVAAVALVVCGLFPLGALLMLPLEGRFERPDREPTFAAVAGIVVLGGGVDEIMTAAHGPVALTEAGSRMTEGVALARRYPEARLAFTGGSSLVTWSGITEADAARDLWTRLGVAPSRMQFEDKSRNTYENAVLTKQLVQPKFGETWLLVTSAYHMPRSVGIFRQAGFPVEAYPVDFRALPWPAALRPATQVSENLRLVDIAVREWMGLVAYRLAGRSDSLFPAP